LTYIHIFTYLF